MQQIFSGNNTYRYKLDLISFFPVRSQGEELKSCIFVDRVFSMPQFSQFIYHIACARLSDSIVWMYSNEQSENKTRATWERAASVPAHFLHFFLLNNFSPLSRSLEQAIYHSTIVYSS